MNPNENELADEAIEGYVKVNNYNYATAEEFDYLDSYCSPWENTEETTLHVEKNEDPHKE